MKSRVPESSVVVLSKVYSPSQKKSFNEPCNSDCPRMSLVRAYFPDENESEQIEMTMRLLNTAGARKIVVTKGLEGVLDEVRGTDDDKLFHKLREHLADEKREELILQRLGGERAGVDTKTPSPLKALEPPVAGSLLVYQVSASAFQGYYPRALTPEQQQSKRYKKTISTSRTFGAERTQLEALQMVVKFLWDAHRKAGHDCKARPTEAQVASALERSLLILSGEEVDDGTELVEPAQEKDASAAVPAAQAAAAAASPEQVMGSSQETAADDGATASSPASSSSSSSSSSTATSKKSPRGNGKAAAAKKASAQKGKAKAKAKTKAKPKAETKSKASAKHQPPAEDAQKRKRRQAATVEEPPKASRKGKLIYDQATGYGSCGITRR